MNILFCYSRDIDINDSGGARTTIELMNSLCKNKLFRIFTSFNVLEGASSSISQLKLSLDANFTEALKDNAIDIIMVPEGQIMIKRIKPLTKGLNVKIVGAFHSMPGYENLNLDILLKESLKYNQSFFKRVRALLCLIVYPLFKIVYVTRIKKAFFTAYTNSDYFILLSKLYFDDFCRKYGLKDGGKKLLAIPNAVSFNYFADEKNIENKKKQILVVARLDEQSKRLSRIFNLWHNISELLNDWELVVVGFGRSETFYHQLIKKYKLERIRMEGKQVPLRYYMDASIFLMTSDYEGWGMTIVEAMQCGCVPVVLDTFRAAHEIIIDGETGYLPQNMTDFESKVIMLAMDRKLRTTMALTAINITKKFLPEHIHRKYSELFESLIK